tara:strand:+ start:277 stop:1845 length:1569 start_codon:yes stop_codon:yes gene_type:complete
MTVEPYTVAGITYDGVTGRPAEFQEVTPLLTPNAVVGSITVGEGDQQEIYGVYANYYQNNNQVQNSSGEVVATGITVNSTGEILKPDQFSSDDVASVQTVMQNVEATGNIQTIAQQQQNNNVNNNNDDGEGSGGSNDASLSNGSDEVNLLRQNYSTGKVDHIIQKLSLRNLVYPIDADFGNTQDYIQINQFSYKPINQDVFFGGLTGNAGSTLLNGLQSTSPKEKHLGLVKLPMPNQLQDSNNVAWGQDQLNAITAAVAGAVFGVSGGGLDLMGDLLAGERKLIGNPDKGQKLSLVGEIRKRFEKDSLNSAGSNFKSFIDKMGNNNDAKLLGRSVLGSAILNVAQFGVSPETALARGAGVVPNSNMQLLFNAPTLREFTFNWRLTARSREEAIRVKNIIRFFKQGMAVKKNNKNKTGEGSFFLGTPNIFDIHFKTSKQNYEILDRNDSVLRIKTCALTGVAVNYTPDGMWNAYEKGMPTSVLLSLRFGELEPIFDTDYEEDPFEFNNRVTDQRSVPIDAIGY